MMFQKLPAMASEKNYYHVGKIIILNSKEPNYSLNDSIRGFEIFNIEFDKKLKFAELKNIIVINNILWANTAIALSGLNKNGKIQASSSTDNVTLNGQISSTHFITRNGKAF